MSYEAVCFDLDRTLCVSTQDAQRVLEAAFESVGCSPFCTHEQLSALVPETPDAFTDLEFHENLFELAATRAGADASVAGALADSYLDVYDPTAVRFRDGAETVLEHARDRTDAVALITNGSRPTQSQKLDALGVADAFDATVFVDPADGVPPKPDPVPFERALSALGTDPGRAIHVGDALYADVAGANAVGMDSAWLATASSEGDEPIHRPTYELSSLDGLSAVL
ncbi:HAD family hydrolase [Halovivax gelatinilyticus]|uniref:HAD family hydrolase n=1 Tax=Halovivax gelatinilyticus TaxID=2961597 RepID=UPI0020CA6982|nr:HAD family hydrolase [Halovivax gelatinilyticus]